MLCLTSTVPQKYAKHIKIILYHDQNWLEGTIFHGRYLTTLSGCSLPRMGQISVCKVQGDEMNMICPRIVRIVSKRSTELCASGIRCKNDVVGW